MGILENTIGAMIGHQAGGGSNRPHGSSPYAPLATALIALLAGKALTGGFGNLGGMFGGHQNDPAGTQPPAQQPSQVPPAQQSGPGGLLAGLGGLLHHFQQNGHTDLVNSWVGAGQNQQPTPDQLGKALGPDTIRDLSRQTGVPEDQVASQLSRELPEVVDKLTPNGRLPTHDEASAWH